MGHEGGGEGSEGCEGSRFHWNLPRISPSTKDSECRQRLRKIKSVVNKS